MMHLPNESQKMKDTRVGRVSFSLQAQPGHGMFQEFQTLTVDDETVSGLFQSVPSGEMCGFSYRLDEIRNLEVRLFQDR
jgi:hypothetical protein